MGPLRSQDAIWALRPETPVARKARMSRRWVARRVAPPRWGSALAGAPGGCKHPAVPALRARAWSPAARSGHDFGVVSRASPLPLSDTTGHDVVGLMPARERKRVWTWHMTSHLLFASCATDPAAGAHRGECSLRQPCSSATAGHMRLFPGLRSYEGSRGRHRTAGASLVFANSRAGRIASCDPVRLQAAAPEAVVRRGWPTWPSGLRNRPEPGAGACRLARLLCDEGMRCHSAGRVIASAHPSTDSPTHRGDPGRRASGVDEGTVRFMQGCLPVADGPRPATAFAASVAVRAGYRAGQWKNGRGYDQLIDGMDDE